MAERGTPGAARARYREFVPAPDLRPLVECFWTIRSPGPLLRPQPNRVVPDGCMDVIVDLGDREGTGRSGAAGSPRSRFVGAMLRPRVVPLTGRVDAVGVRFHPGVGGALLRMPASELTDRTMALDDVLPGRPGPEVEDALARAADTRGRVAAMEALLRRWLADVEPPPAPVRAATALIVETRGCIGVRELERRIGLSVRQLERLFARFAGTTPKAACRVARFRSAWLRLHDPEPVSLSGLAHRAGYADQAHFTREFGEFAGLPPGRYRDVASVQDATSPGD